MFIFESTGITSGFTKAMRSRIEPAERKLKGNEMVIKDPSFTQSAYTLEVIELRLVALAIIVLRQDNRSKDGEDFIIDPTKPIQIHANLYADLFQTTRQNAYSKLEIAANSLQGRMINWIDIYEDRKSGRKAERINNLRWTSQCSYIPSMGFVELYFSPQIIPFLQHINNNYVGYEIHNLAKLTTPYMFRMYELGASWKKKGVATFKKETLRLRLGILDDNQFSTASNFNRLLNKSLDTINRETDLNMSFTPIKENVAGVKGLQITGYQMTVTVKKGLAQPLTAKQMAALGLDAPDNDNSIPPVAIPKEDLRTVNQDDEDAFLENLGQNQRQMRFGSIPEDVDYKERPENEKPAESQGTFAFMDQPVPVKKSTVLESQSKAKKPHGIVKVGSSVQAWPNEDGSWDFEGIIQNMDKPYFQIIGMSDKDISEELAMMTADYQKHVAKGEKIALLMARASIASKIVSGLRYGKGIAADVRKEDSRLEKCRHDFKVLTQTQINAVMQNPDFVAKYAPMGHHDASIVRSKLLAMLTGDLTKIPDLADYVPFITP